ncbi:uncharacterized protein [Physeter macrocephalus]|uniref:Cystatin domain-containing protein n=1 Tax=Physeter macrocephalus TaxID=9755 RepID=A0A455C9Z8_PHYMC|nr:uncharacterized protein LOC114487540 [Physeter catodon]|eukprot:XP_028353806.1 uncharacterized protein LOC114487540 [Physeter catodon]
MAGELGLQLWWACDSFNGKLQKKWPCDLQAAEKASFPQLPQTLALGEAMWRGPRGAHQTAPEALPAKAGITGCQTRHTGAVCPLSCGPRGAETLASPADSAPPPECIGFLLSLCFPLTHSASSGPQLVVTHGWQPQGEGNGEDQGTLELYFPATVEYAVHVFNQRSQDRNAYKVVRVLRSWKEPANGIVFSTELQLGRTRCGKFDEDIDNCPFQASPDVNNVRHATAALRLHGRGRCLGAGGVRSDDNAVPRDTEGHLQDGAQPGRPAPVTCTPLACLAAAPQVTLGSGCS